MNFQERLSVTSVTGTTPLYRSHPPASERLLDVRNTGDLVATAADYDHLKVGGGLRLPGRSSYVQSDARATTRIMMTDSIDDTIIETPEGPMTWAAWKKKNPVQVPSRRTKGKDLPVKVKKFTEPK